MEKTNEENIKEIQEKINKLELQIDDLNVELNFYKENILIEEIIKLLPDYHDLTFLSYDELLEFKEEILQKIK